MVYDNLAFAGELAANAVAAPPAVAVPADTPDMTHRRLAELRMMRKGHTDVAGPLSMTTPKFRRSPPAQFAMALEASDLAALEDTVFKVSSTIEGMWDRNPNIVSNYVQTYGACARMAWLMNQPVPLPTQITIPDLNGGNPVNLPATALVLRQPKLTIWTILDSVIDLMYGWITYLDWKEAESLSQAQALMHQFHGADPGLTAEQRRVGTVMATWALRGRGGGGGGRGGRAHNNHGGYPHTR